VSSAENQKILIHWGLRRSKPFLWDGLGSERSTPAIRTIHRGGTGPWRTESTDIRDQVNGDSPKGPGCRDQQ
jgi:hypothetical protein